MKSKLFAIIVSLIITLVVFYGIDFLTCAIHPCVDDDASRRAMTMLGTSLLILYIVTTWGIIYPLMLVLRKYLGKFVSPLIVSILFTSLLALVFHDPQVDGNVLNTIFVFLIHLGAPWYLGGFTAILLWSNKTVEPIKNPRADF